MRLQSQSVQQLLEKGTLESLKFLPAKPSYPFLEYSRHQQQIEVRHLAYAKKETN